MSKFLCKDGIIVLIDLDELEKYDTLNDSFAFKNLFCLKNKNNLEKDSNDNYLLLSRLNINSNEWYELITFIKNGHPSYYSFDLENDYQKRNLFISSLEKLNLTCLKAGGIKSFDKFYKDFNQKIISMENVYNPMEPNKDFKNMYDWGIGIINHSVALSSSYEKLNPNDGWVTTKIFCKGKENYFYSRKIKIE